MFSNFQVEYGRDDEGNNALLRVPVRYGDASRQAQTILQQNSANSMPSTPLMTFYITGLDYDRPRMQEPYHVNKMQVRQRTYDQSTDTYETTQGNAFTVERLMPVPYKLTINLDIWTSNTNQKFQLFEQIATLFNPSLEIQSTDNYIDWTSLSVVELDRVNFSSRTIPNGTGSPIDIMTMTFVIPIWVSSPTKIKKLGVIDRIINSVYDAQGDTVNAITNNDLLLGTRLKVTPYEYQVLLLNGQLQILRDPTVMTAPNTSVNPFTFPIVQNPQVKWPNVFNIYGALRPGISIVTLDNPWDPDSSIIGTVAINPADDRLAIFNIDPDTVPQNTLDPVTAVVNPLVSGPGRGLPSAAVGQRYLFTQGTGDTDNTENPVEWAGVNSQPLIANANDIVYYDGSRWRIEFDSENMPDTQYVTNITTGIQYKWNSVSWVKSIDGLYQGGSWNLIL
jgi:hypothetical protein